LHYETLVKKLNDAGILETYMDNNGKPGLQLCQLGKLFEDETLALFFSPAVKRTLAMKASGEPRLRYA
jgi:oxygen-independent coproporphyrinogen-3 oxidase